MEDDIFDFFDFSKDFKRNEVAPGCLSGDPKVLATNTCETKVFKREQIGTEYITEIVNREKQLLNTLVDKGAAVKCKNKTLDDLSDDEYDENEVAKIRSDEAYYKKYPFDLNRNKNLPIYAQREEIVAAIEACPIVIIKGETGCGKTTQVPQYILDEAYKSGEYCNIVVTQPRRIAAISIAQRVCQERKWAPNTVCSYQVGLHRPNSSDDTRLLFCTTGVLLNHVVNHKTLSHYTHIVLDEVHERDQDMDFLLIVVRHLLAKTSPHVKIILMSATIDATLFANYFATTKGPPPIITVGHGRKYPLVVFYRDQLRSVETRMEERLEPGIRPETYAAAIKILLIIDNMERSVEKTMQQSYEDALAYGAVLVFLPGINEIEVMAENITNVMKENPFMKMTLIRCHSQISPETQREVFHTPPRGHRKIILTTNIAESSITVPDVSYVIDFCLSKVLVTDTATNFSTLQLGWASKTNCRQRAGRVGRTRPGRVYRLVTKTFYQQCMDEFCVPEMLRSPLQNSVLKVKRLAMGKPSEILALAISPPNLSDIRNTVLQLKEVGALFKTVDGVYDELDGDLTYWGKIMGNLPLDVRLSRLIILGYIFNCLDEAIVMAAGLTVRSFYTQSGRAQMFDQLWMHYTWADGSGSDLIAIWRLYNTYKNMCLNRNMADGAEQWARRYHLNIRSLKELHLLVQELYNRCERHNLLRMPYKPKYMWDDHEKSIILKVIIAGAFYPNYFIRKNKTSMEKEREVYGILSGHDPCSTVYFTNFEGCFTGELYTRRIKQLFAAAHIPPEHMDVTFQHGSQRVFVSFKRHEDAADATVVAKVPGRIVTEVYKAMRLRKSSLAHRLNVMDHFSALRYVEEHHIGEVIEGRWAPPSSAVNIELYTLPSVFDKTIIGYITHIVNCGKFYFQPLSLVKCIANMSDILNAPQHLNCHVRNASAVTKGRLLLAYHEHSGNFQRARVLKVETQHSSVPKFRVRFVDYGDSAVLPLDKLRLLSPGILQEYEHLPPRMFECRLALVQPSFVTSCYNFWPQEADRMLLSLAKCGRVELEIYSLVNNKAAVIIHMREGILNDKLVEDNWARRADEDFLSRQDHDFRMRRQEQGKHMSQSERCDFNEQYLRSAQQPIDENLEPPPEDKCRKVLSLKGPYSPLETTMYSLVHAGIWKTLEIESDSVNSVLLHSDPQDQHDQLVVAATVVNSNQRKMLKARNTTLMPNIHGFGALMTAIFCPTMQLKCNEERTKFVCLLAGLGYDEDTLQSLYEEHDIVINLDVNLLKDDITIINQIRYYMDLMFFNHSVDEVPMACVEDRVLIFNTMRKLISRLLNKDRSYIESHVSNSDYRWENLGNLEVAAEPFGKRSIFPMHSIQELQQDKMGDLLALKENCRELYTWRNFDGSMQPLECQLCHQYLENVAQLRLHLLMQLHRDREKQIGFRLD